MTEDIFKLLKEKERENQKEKKFYVYYEPSTGEIIHLRNYLEEDSRPFISINESDLDEPIEKFKIESYRVLEKKKKMKLVKIDNLIDQITIENLIYQIPRIDIKDRTEIKKHHYDIVVEQNNKDKVFRLKLSSETKKNFSAQPQLRQLILNIYVTAENDPHILYKTLEFRLQDLLDHQFYTIDFDDYIGKPCNLFARKYFQTYLHADIR